MSFEFQGMLYDSESKWYRASAESWLWAGGWNDRADIIGFLDTMTPDDLARECRDGWWADEEEDAPDLDDLTAMFADLARNRAWLTA